MQRVVRDSAFVIASCHLQFGCLELLASDEHDAIQSGIIGGDCTAAGYVLHTTSCSPSPSTSMTLHICLDSALTLLCELGLSLQDAAATVIHLIAC